MPWVAAAAPYIAIIGAAAAAAGTGVSIAAAKSQADYQSELAERNAKIARDTAEAEAERHRIQALQIISTQRAKYLAAGVALEGSPLLVMAKTKEQIELDTQLIRYRGLLGEAAAETEAAGYREAGKSAVIGGSISMAGDFLSSMGKQFGTTGTATKSNLVVQPTAWLNAKKAGVRGSGSWGGNR